MADKTLYKIKKIIKKAVELDEDFTIQREQALNGGRTDIIVEDILFYYRVIFLRQVIPVIEEYVDDEEAFSINELLMAICLKNIGMSINFKYAGDMTYGLLMGNLSYVDILERSIEYEDEDAFHLDWDLATRKEKNEIREYYDTYGDDLRFVDNLSDRAYDLMLECMKPVIIYQCANADSIEDFYAQCDIYNMPEHMKKLLVRKIYTTHKRTRAVGRMIDVKQLIKRVHEVYPLKSLELKNIATAIMCGVALSDHRDMADIEKDVKKLEDNHLALVVADFDRMVFGKAYVASELCILRYGERHPDDERMRDYLTDIFKRYDNSNYYRYYFYIDIKYDDTKLYDKWMQNNQSIIKDLKSEKIRESIIRGYNGEDARGNFRECFLSDIGCEGMDLSDERGVSADILMTMLSKDFTIHKDYGRFGEHAIKKQYERRNRDIQEKVDEFHKNIEAMDVNITENELLRIDEFLVGKLQVRHDAVVNEGNVFPHSELMISIDESEFSESLIRCFTKAVSAKGSNYVILDAATWTAGQRNIKDYFQSLTFFDFICVKSFKRHPIKNRDSATTGGEAAEQKKALKNFKNMWKGFVDFVQENPQIAFVIVTNN